MIFSPPLYGKVLRGEKTQTRRLAQSGDLATKYRPGMRRAVQRGRGIPAEAHIILTDVRREPLTEFDALERFDLRYAQREVWVLTFDLDGLARTPPQKKAPRTMPDYRPPKSPPSVHNPWRPAVPPLDPQPAPLHPRYGGNDPGDDFDEADRRREQWPASER